MKIIEEYIVSKTGRILDCEDLIYKSDDFIAVIDGATPKNNFIYNKKTTGQLAAEIISDALRILPNSSTAPEAIDFISSAIEDFYNKNHIYEKMIKKPENRLTASVVVFSKFRREVWLVGDCQAIVNSKHINSPKDIDEILSNVRSLFIDIEIQKGKGITYFQDRDYAREYIKPLLVKQATLQNNHNSLYGFPVIDGFKVIPEKIIVCKVDKNSNFITLASDGYPILKDTLASSESELKSIVSNDPLLYKKYKSTKGLLKDNISYDDRSYISFCID